MAVIANALRALRWRAAASADHLSRSDADRMKAEHVQLGHVMAQIRALADELPRLPSTSVAGALANLNDSLMRQLVPHEQHDDAQVYPGLARLLGGRIRWRR